MKLKDLRAKIEQLYRPYPDGSVGKDMIDDLEVVIPIDERQIGPIANEKISSANRGFDWETRMFILWPEHKVKRG